jgi:nicotinate-nucleotide adenylyltransferase
MREHLSLDQVLFVPNQVSPFKTGTPPTPGERRAQMVELAIAGNDAFTVWRGELGRTGPSYTVETLRTLRSEFPKAQLYFLTGMDAIAGLPGWKEPEAVLELAQMVATIRPGVTEAEARERLPDAWETKILFVAMPPLDISATEIRELAHSGRSLRYLMPPAVVEFIHHHRLY